MSRPAIHLALCWLMTYIRPATEHEVVLAFLKAEVEAPRYREAVQQALAPLNVRREDLIDRGGVYVALRRQI